MGFRPHQGIIFLTLLDLVDTNIGENIELFPSPLGDYLI